MVEILPASPVFREVDLGNQKSIPRTEGAAIPSDLRQYTEICYQVREVRAFGSKKYYVVKIGEDGILEDLLAIQESEIKKVQDEAFKEGVWTGECTEIDRIKKLPWWKRLFNKF